MSYLLIGEEKQQAEAWLKVRFKDEQPPCLPKWRSVWTGNSSPRQVGTKLSDCGTGTVRCSQASSQVRLIAHNKNFSASPCLCVSPNYGYSTGHDITGHKDAVDGVAFSPAGKLLVSGSQDHMVMLWNLDRVLDVDQLLAYSCNWVHDYLKHNSEVVESDRHLCGNINTHK